MCFLARQAPATMLVLSLGERTIAFMFLQSLIIAVIASFWSPYACSICSFFHQRMNLNATLKSVNKSVASRFFAHNPSIISWIVRICGVVDRFL